MRGLLIFIVGLMAWCPFVTQAYAGDVRPDYDAFSRIPVLSEGRIKPVESYARAKLRSFSGRDYSDDGRPAVQWLADMVFTPAEEANNPVFLIKNADLKRRLDLEEGRPDDLYSLIEVLPGVQATSVKAHALMSRPPGNLNAQQKIFLSIHEKVADYLQIMRSLSLLLPLNIDIPAQYEAEIDIKAGLGPNFIDLEPVYTSIKGEVRDIVKEKGDDPSLYSPEEQQLAILSFQLEEMARQGGINTSFQVLPDFDLTGSEGGTHDILISPWQYYRKGVASEGVATQSYLTLWDEIARSYRNKDWESWNANLETYLKDDRIQTVAERTRFALEKIYVSVKPYRFVLVFYALCLFRFIVAGRNSVIKNISIMVCFLGFITHLSAIFARIYILGRPPVGTLYESVLFVSLLCVLGGLWAYMRDKKGRYIYAGPGAALILLGLAPVMAPEGENLEVLSAVLNTGFWLGTHVLVITAGYALCVLCACMSHIELARAAFMRIASGKGNEAHKHDISGSEDKPLVSLSPAMTMIYRFSLFSLLFTAVGTILGGIWADQSWGRFWGWDPKENGALLIVLWLIWVQHGRISGHFGDLATLALFSALNIVVTLAWFGVNLLSVGLHSYGFTSGFAWGLGVFCTLEAIFIVTCYILAKFGLKMKRMGERRT